MKNANYLRRTLLLLHNIIYKHIIMDGIHERQQKETEKLFRDIVKVNEINITSIVRLNLVVKDTFYSNKFASV